MTKAPEKIYILEEETMDLLRKMQADLHGGTDRERDYGHKLMLFLDRAVTAWYDEESSKTEFPT